MAIRTSSLVQQRQNFESYGIGSRLLGKGYFLSFRRGYPLKLVEFRVRRRQSVVVERKEGIHIQASLSPEKPEHFIAHFADAFWEVWMRAFCTPLNCSPLRV